MEILSDRVGILLKFGKVMGSLTKRFFFIDNKGILYYTEKENIILELLKSTTYDEYKFISILSPVSKIINLNESLGGISEIKSYLEEDYQLRSRSYFELFLRSREYRATLLFSWKDEYIKFLRDYVNTFNEKTNNINEETEMILDQKENEIRNYDREVVFSDKNKNYNNIFLNAKSKDHNEQIIAKLGGKFVNQKNWEKDCIGIVNPSSNLEDYEETWAELENGSNYSGPVKNGMPHGFGKEYRPDGSLYTGNFFRGKWHGLGTLTNETLDSYQGEFIDGCICGI